jgi:hypothetical protein
MNEGSSGLREICNGRCDLGLPGAQLALGRTSPLFPSNPTNSRPDSVTACDSYRPPGRAAAPFHAAGAAVGAAAAAAAASPSRASAMADTYSGTRNR